MNACRVVKYTVPFMLFVLLVSFSACRKEKVSTDETFEITHVKERKARFTGNYNREFNDMNELHMASAVSNGITPMTSRDDTLTYAKKLVRLPDALELYKTYDLTHSVPFLVPSAAQLFVDICVNFRDSLYNKGLPLHRLYLTSVTRTDDDLTRLTRRNINASENSAHRYGTTFDISWKRFEQVDVDSTVQVAPEGLKLVLAQVIFDLKNQERCYVKHERKQACFHITVR